MIKLKTILTEISEQESERLLSKIRNKEFQFFNSGDNGKVYSINGEDLLKKITSEPDEIAVADDNLLARFIIYMVLLSE